MVRSFEILIQNDGLNCFIPPKAHEQLHHASRRDYPDYDYSDRDYRDHDYRDRDYRDFDDDGFPEHHRRGRFNHHHRGRGWSNDDLPSNYIH